MRPKSQQQIVRMETYAKFPYLVEVTLPDNSILRYANSDTDIVFEGNTFEGAYFKITPPEKTETGFKDAHISFSVLDNSWIERIRSFDKASLIRFVAIIDYNDNGQRVCESLQDITFKLGNANWGDHLIEFTMKFDEKINVNVPVLQINEFTCPALY